VTHDFFNLSLVEDLPSIPTGRVNDD
jgi:hypothetical protein